MLLRVNHFPLFYREGVLDATGGDVRRAQRLSRHADIRTLQRYDDNREDLQGEVSGLLSAIFHPPTAV